VISKDELRVQLEKALRFADRQERRRHLHANRMAAGVLRPGGTASIPVEPGDRVIRAGFQCGPQHV
jgi:hypothetical protein